MNRRKFLTTGLGLSFTPLIVLERSYKELHDKYKGQVITVSVLKDFVRDVTDV